MKIETKFDIGQKVYYIDFKNVVEMKISFLEVYKTDIFYYDTIGCCYNEEDLFATKEEAEQKLKEIENAKN
jgi:hypothetical protein